MLQGDEDALLTVCPYQFAAHALVGAYGDQYVVVALDGVVSTVEHDDVLVVSRRGQDEVLHLAVGNRDGFHLPQ